MLRLRLAGGLATLGLLIGGGMALKGPAGSAPLMAAPAAARSAVLEIFYTPPVLVRMGERVLMPVDVVCATRAGTACLATVEIGSRVGSEAWRRTTVPAVKDLQLDMSGPAARAVGSGSSPSSTGRVEFYLRARDAAGRTTSLGSERAPLAFYVTRRLPVVTVPAIPFGSVRRGHPVLSLPWGSGPMKAGLQPGMESATLGPSSFDVDSAGRIYLADSLQDRLAVFSGRVLVREASMPLGHKADIAAGARGKAYVADAAGDSVTVRTVDATGRTGTTNAVGAGSSFHVTAPAGRPSVELLPAAEWIDVSDDQAESGVGMPLGSGSRLIRLGTDAGVRVGTVTNGALADAVEIRSTVGFGEVALCQRDGSDGYLVVVHTWRAKPDAADQYQVIRVVHGAVLENFAVANTIYTETPPLSRFRIGADGALYQMVTTSSSMNIVRFELGRTR